MARYPFFPLFSKTFPRCQIVNSVPFFSLNPFVGHLREIRPILTLALLPAGYGPCFLRLAHLRPVKIIAYVNGNVPPAINDHIRAATKLKESQLLFTKLIKTEEGRLI